MKDYKSNISDYVDEKFLGEKSYKLGEEMYFLTGEEHEANFCTLETIKKVTDGFSVILSIENEWTGERYKKTYTVQKGCKLQMDMLTPNLACFLPPNRVPVLAEVTAISLEGISIKPIGVTQDFAAIMEKCG